MTLLWSEMLYGFTFYQYFITNKEINIMFMSYLLTMKCY